MDKKTPKNESHKYHAAGGCSSSCKKCEGTCSLDTNHNGPHKCGAGHNWS